MSTMSGHPCNTDRALPPPRRMGGLRSAAGRVGGILGGILCGCLLASTGLAAAPPAPASAPAPATFGSAAVTAPARAGRETQPVWEAGLGLSVLTLPDYRGAGTRHGYVLPLPYLVYRSPHLSLDRGGLKAELFGRPGWELDFSVNLSVPVRSDGNPAREGMPSLRPSLEVGPQLLADLWASGDGRRTLQLQLPLRYAFAMSRGTRDVGVIFHPRLALDIRDAGAPGWNLGLIAGPLFATARHHDYFYSVAPQYATATRESYRAGGGYGGMQWTAAVSKRFPSHWFGAFVRVDQLHGAVFADSPLVQKRTTVSAGLAVSWIFAESAARIARR